MIGADKGLDSEKREIMGGQTNGKENALCKDNGLNWVHQMGLDECTFWKKKQEYWVLKEE